MGTWVVVADSCQARILDWTSPDEPLVERADLVHPASRLRDSAITSDRPGSAATPAGGHHAVSGAHTPHDHEASVFAKQVAGHLDDARVKGQVHRLVVMAPPSFLGRLRAELTVPTRALVAAEVAKDVVKVKLHDLPRHLPEILDHHEVV